MIRSGRSAQARDVSLGQLKATSVKEARGSEEGIHAISGEMDCFHTGDDTRSDELIQNPPL